MFQILGEVGNAVLALRITGGISDRETRRIVHIIQAHASRHGKTRLFVSMAHYPSFNSAEDLYEDLRFVRLCENLIECMAVVGDRPWRSTWIGLFGLFGGIATACFDQSETQEALQWLAGQSSLRR